VPTETEVKLRLRVDPTAGRARLEALGYRVVTPRQHEADQLFDREGAPLRQADQILRLRRRGDRATLTYKGPAQRAPHKSRTEIEVEVSDGAACEQILTALGYRPTFRYEKYRTTFAAAGEPGHILLDETPAGNFLELEGPGDWIDATAARLGYSAADYITQSYASLWRTHCAENPQAVPEAMVF
jgi:adenylate cyclase class 2